MPLCLGRSDLEQNILASSVFVWFFLLLFTPCPRTSFCFWPFGIIAPSCSFANPGRNHVTFFFLLWRLMWSIVVNKHVWSPLFKKAAANVVFCFVCSFCSVACIGFSLPHRVGCTVVLNDAEFSHKFYQMPPIAEFVEARVFKISRAPPKKLLKH